MMNRHANIEPLDRRMLCAERSLLLAFALDGSRVRTQ